MRNFYLYMLRPKVGEKFVSQGNVFVKFDRKHLDKRGWRGRKSKASRILDFLKENWDKAFYTTEIAGALRDYGVQQTDVSSNMRRFERRGLIYIRGYKTVSRARASVIA